MREKQAKGVFQDLGHCADILANESILAAAAKEAGDASGGKKK